MAALTWDAPPGARGTRSYTTRVAGGIREPVFLARVPADGTVAVTLRGAGTGSIEIGNVMGTGGSARFSTTSLPSWIERSNDGTLTFDAVALLASVSGSVNRNLIKVSVGGRAAPLLHLVRQEVIVFLPGVLASQLTVQGSPSWPHLPPPAAPALMKLECDIRGVPRMQCTSLKVIDTGGLIYPRLKFEEWLSKGCPEITIMTPREMPLPHYRVQLYPYDWRIDFNVVIDILLGPAGPLPGGTKLFETNPVHGGNQISLRTLLGELRARPELELLSDKVCLAGHSTGGVIVNGLIRRPAAAELVDRAFFIASPFFGAHKPFFSFLKGTMGLGLQELLIMDETAWCTLACNMPVIYGLAATSDWKDDVRRNVMTIEQLVVGAPQQEYGFGKIGDAMRLMIGREQERGKERAQKLVWNDQLWNDAIEYHRSCKRPVTVRPDRCWVYYSQFLAKGATTSRNTPGPLTYQGHVRYEEVKGDGTVGIYSLRGDWPNDRIVDLGDMTLDHVGIAVAEKTWRDIATRF